MNMNWLPDRDYIIFATAVVTGIVGVLLFVAPSALPIPVESLADVTSVLSLTQTAWIITGLLLVIVIARFLAGATTPLDRSPITTQPPEIASNGGGVSEPTEALASTYEGVLESFNSPGHIQRRIAMYGRRAGEHEDLPDAYERFFAEIAVTARDTYATSSTVTVDTAETAIATGTWTDDRIAAAFLATDVTADPTFTLFERITAWLAPRHTFRNRMDRTIAAIEDHANGYLTYTSPRDEMQRHTGGDDRMVDNE